jgi:hypothetical protein
MTFATGEYFSVRVRGGRGAMADTHRFDYAAPTSLRALVLFVSFILHAALCALSGSMSDSLLIVRLRDLLAPFVGMVAVPLKARKLILPASRRAS